MRSILGLSLVLMSCSAAQSDERTVDQTLLDALGSELTVKYAVASNLDDTACRAHIKVGECFSARITLSTKAHAIPESTTLYFSHIAPVEGFTSESNVDIEHVNGDLHRVSFHQSIPPNTEITANLSSPFWHASRSDAMPNYYITFGDLQPVVLNSTARITEPGSQLLVNQHATQWSTKDQYLRSSEDSMPLMDSAYFYDAHSLDVQREVSEKSLRVIPQVAAREDTGKTGVINGVTFTPETATLLAPARAQLASFGLSEIENGVPVTVTISKDDAKYAHYTLAISDTDIQINAGSTLGANYALLTLMQLFDSETKHFPITTISDAPRFAFRGMHVDVARHFLGKQAIETLITQMFTYKLNKLHLHLSDDEGWRVEINALPELTEIGAFRCHDVNETRCLMPQLGSGPHRNAMGNGYLSEQDYIDIVKMAHERGIEVIPSFDMPGHARAAIVAMNARHQRLLSQQNDTAATQYLLTDANDKTQYQSVQFYNDNTMNPCLDSTYAFVETVMVSIKQLHEKAEVPLNTFHIGADETSGAWSQSPVCLAKDKDPSTLLPEFVTKVQRIASKLDLSIGGWSDGMEKAVSTLDSENAYANVWDVLAAGGSDNISHFSEAGIPVVLSFPDVLYFDFPYASHPFEPGYYWGSKATSVEKVFSLMPEHLSLHSNEWVDRMGDHYTPKADADISTLVGIQGQLWTEVTINQQAMEYMMFPRLLALAERAWHQSNWQRNADSLSAKKGLFDARQQDWLGFQSALFTTHFQALIKQNINVRVPPPAAKINDDTLYMHPVEGLIMEYSEDGSNWSVYTRPVTVKGKVFVRSRVVGTAKASRHVYL
mgnify:FL=1